MHVCMLGFSSQQGLSKSILAVVTSGGKMSLAMNTKNYGLFEHLLTSVNKVFLALEILVLIMLYSRHPVQLVSVCKIVFIDLHAPCRLQGSK